MLAPCIEEAALIQGPVLDLRRRLVQLLAEWPDHPVLLQLAGICDRLLSLPVNCTLKTALTGVELLLARAQLWEETAAKHVTLGPLLAQLVALSRRWRKLELGSWRSLLQRTVARFSEGAAQAWFHLYRILVDSTNPVGDVTLAVEQFVQASPLGEFAARLALLATFERQLAAMAAPALAGGAPPERRRELAVALFNVRRYYAQFQPHVQRTIGDGVALLEKDLQVRADCHKYRLFCLLHPIQVASDVVSSVLGVRCS